MAEGNTPPRDTTQPDTRFGQGFVYDTWYFAAVGTDLIPGKLQRYEVMGEPVLLGRDRKGEVYGLRDICPHRAAPLSAGRMTTEADGAQSIECPYHGWRFRTDGVCSAIPSLVSDQEMEVNRISVRRYPVAESQGLVFIWMATDPRKGEPDQPVPTFPGVVGGGPKLVDRMDFESHIDHAVVGLMDPAHGPYVHRQWWWRSAKSQHDKAKKFEPREAGFSMVRHEPSKNSRAYAILGGEPLTEITFRLPGMRWEHITVGPKQVLLLTFLTPIHANRTRITQLIWSDHWAFTFKRIFAPFVRAFLRQDGDMVNLQNMGLTYDPSLLWIDDADRQAKWYQQLKREWAAARKEGRPFRNPVEATTLKWRS